MWEMGTWFEVRTMNRTEVVIQWRERPLLSCAQCQGWHCWIFHNIRPCILNVKSFRKYADFTRPLGKSHITLKCPFWYFHKGKCSSPCLIFLIAFIYKDYSYFFLTANKTLIQSLKHTNVSLQLTLYIFLNEVPHWELVHSTIFSLTICMREIPLDLVYFDPATSCVWLCPFKPLRFFCSWNTRSTIPRCVLDISLT